jgi:hypothetical protein
MAHTWLDLEQIVADELKVAVAAPAVPGVHMHTRPTRTCVEDEPVLPISAGEADSERQRQRLKPASTSRPHFDDPRRVK